MIKKLLSEIKKIIPEDCFLVGNTAKAAHEGTLEDLKLFHIGFFNESDRKQADEKLADGFKWEGEVPNVKVIFVTYESNGSYYECKFKRNPALALRFLGTMLDHPKKKRIGNTYWKVPTPIEDYLECTFNEDGTYKKVEV